MTKTGNFCAFGKLLFCRYQVREDIDLDNIEDAVRIDPRDIRNEFEQLPIGQTVLAYYTWPNEETSASVAHFLRKEGYQARAIEEGGCGEISCNCIRVNCNIQFGEKQKYWRWLGLDEAPPKKQQTR